MSGQSMFWVLLVSGIWGIVALAVPREQIWKLGMPSFFGGFLWALLLQFVGISLGLWHFPSAGIPISGIPLAILFAWWGAVVLFLAYLPQQNLNRYILLMATATVALNTVALWNGAILFLRWNLFFTFVLALFSHWALAYGYLLWTRRTTRS